MKAWMSAIGNIIQFILIIIALLPIFETLFEQIKGILEKRIIRTVSFFVFIGLVLFRFILSLFAMYKIISGHVMVEISNAFIICGLCFLGYWHTLLEASFKLT